MARTTSTGQDHQDRNMKHGFAESIREEFNNAPRGDFKQTLDHLFHAIGDHVRKDPYGAVREAATFGASLAAINPNQFRQEVSRFVKELFQTNGRKTEETENESEHQS